MTESGRWLESRSARPPDGWKRASVQPHFRPLFEACDRLEGRVMDALSAATSEFFRTKIPVVQLSVPRALHSFDALLHLVDAGYGAPALALSRTLIEDTVASWWLARSNPETIIKLLRAHELSVTLMVQGEKLAEADYVTFWHGGARLTSDEVQIMAQEQNVDLNLGCSPLDKEVSEGDGTRHSG